MDSTESGQKIGAGCVANKAGGKREGKEVKVLTEMTFSGCKPGLSQVYSGSREMKDEMVQ